MYMQNIYTQSESSNVIRRYDNIIDLFERRLVNEKQKQEQEQKPKDDRMFIKTDYALPYKRMLEILKRRREIVELLDEHSLLEKCKTVIDFADLFDEKSINRSEIDALYKAYNLNLLTISNENSLVNIDLARFLDTFNREYKIIYEQLNNFNDDERKSKAYESVIESEIYNNKSHTAFDENEKMKNWYIGLVAGNAQDRSEFAKEIFRVIPKIVYQDLRFY
ncbi:hypothetical protein ACR56S_04095 [Staphylococcus hominis]|uniref:hypothetical protein n=1 Tax=Staphylococcus hominis TaxID=1290 RepID=UPI003D9FBCBB